MAYKTKMYGSPAVSGPQTRSRYAQEKIEFRPSPKLLRELQGNEGTAEIDWERGSNGMIEITAINGISIGRMDNEPEAEAEEAKEVEESPEMGSPKEAEEPTEE
jgi:hypothetical protein